VRELRYDEDREPAKGKGIEQLQVGSEDGEIVVIQEERLPYVDAVREHTYVNDGAGVEDATHGRRWITDAPQKEESDRDTADGKADREIPVILESGAQKVGYGNHSGWNPPDLRRDGIKALKGRVPLQ